ncbi:MAG: hypothetical protein RL207_1464 [Bacteroidota bacterium]|jgi:hypothetical protein
MIKLLTWIPITLLLIAACGKKRVFEEKDLMGQVWIYNTDSLADSIRNFTDNYLIFEKNAVTMNGENMGEFTISKDTLKIFKSYTILLGKGKEVKKVDYLFVGTIQKVDEKQLVLHKIAGFFPINYERSKGPIDPSTRIVFNNQESRKKKIEHFQYISIASSKGETIELDAQRNITYHCSMRCSKTGYFQGRISKANMQKVLEAISYLNLHTDSTNYAMGIDAPETLVKIHVNHKMNYVRGDSNNFQYELQHLIFELLELCETSNLKRSTQKLFFRAELDKEHEIKTPFTPPISQEDN